MSLAVFKKSHQLEVPVDPTEMYTFTRMSAVAYAEVPSGCKGVTRFIAKSTSGEAVSINHEYESILFETMGTSWSTCGTTVFEFVLVNQPSLIRFAEGITW